MMKTISIIVTGKVQGVFFRQSTLEKASSSGIAGEVKNMPDNSVRIIATGNPDQLEDFVAWCRHGPARAEVKKVFTEELELRSFNKFSILR